MRNVKMILSFLIVFGLFSCNGRETKDKKAETLISNLNTEKAPFDFWDKKYRTEELNVEDDMMTGNVAPSFGGADKSIGSFVVYYIGKTKDERDYWSIKNPNGFFKKSERGDDFDNLFNNSIEIEKILKERINNYYIIAFFLDKKYITYLPNSNDGEFDVAPNAEDKVYIFKNNEWEFIKSVKTASIPDDIVGFSLKLLNGKGDSLQGKDSIILDKDTVLIIEPCLKTIDSLKAELKGDFHIFADNANSCYPTIIEYLDSTNQKYTSTSDSINFFYRDKNNKLIKIQSQDNWPLYWSVLFFNNSNKSYKIINFEIFQNIYGIFFSKSPFDDNNDEDSLEKTIFYKDANKHLVIREDLLSEITKSSVQDHGKKASQLRWYVTRLLDGIASREGTVVPYTDEELYKITAYTINTVDPIYYKYWNADSVSWGKYSIPMDDRGGASFADGLSLGKVLTLDELDEMSAQFRANNCYNLPNLKEMLNKTVWSEAYK